MDSGKSPNGPVTSEKAKKLTELAVLLDTLDTRYDDLKSGRVKSIDGDEAFARLREKSEQRKAEVIAAKQRRS